MNRAAISTYPVRIAVVAALVCISCADTFAQPPEKELDERLSADETRLIASLTERQMPELVEALLVDRPETLHPHIAGAYGRVGLTLRDPALRTAFCAKSLEWFRRCLPALSNSGRLSDELQRFEAAGWLTEYADLVVRFECAADLDNYELTSGLDFNRGRLLEQLREAAKRYEQADDLLKPLVMGLRTQEEKYLLIGLTERIERLAEARGLSAAWASVYLGMVLEPNAPGRGTQLSNALAGFDQVARDSRDKDRKYNALIGAGVALRESGRADEAASSLNRVILSTAETTAVARARYEKVRTLLASGQFHASRDEIKALSALSRFPDAADALFYIRLAPLLEAHSYALQSSARVENSPEMVKLRETAMEKFSIIAKQGGPWPGIVETYLANLSGQSKPLAQMSVEELRTTALRWMAKGKYAEALPLLLELAGRKGATADDELNLGVCLFQNHRVSEAAERFGRAEALGQGEVSDRAAEYAYRCRKQLVLESKSKLTLLALAEAAKHLAQRHGTSPLAYESEYAAGAAFQEAGYFGEAASAYKAVRKENPKYWFARRGVAECLSARLEIPFSRPSGEWEKEAANQWSSLALDLEKGGHGLSDAMATMWRNEARLKCAALHATTQNYLTALGALTGVPDTVESRMIRLRCRFALDEWDLASGDVDGLLAESDQSTVMPAILRLVADIQRLAKRTTPNVESHEQFAKKVLPILEKVENWVGKQRRERNAIRSVRLQIIRSAGRAAEALSLAETLVKDDPDNGSHLHCAASLLEQIAQSVPQEEKIPLWDRAEGYWARLLEDGALRDSAPKVYWEARFQWLTHQLRHGKKAEVAKAIETERAWYPELGGPPWQGKLVELLEEAKPGAGLYP